MCFTFAGARCAAFRESSVHSNSLPHFHITLLIRVYSNLSVHPHVPDTKLFPPVRKTISYKYIHVVSLFFTLSRSYTVLVCTGADKSLSTDVIKIPMLFPRALNGHVLEQFSSLRCSLKAGTFFLYGVLIHFQQCFCVSYSSHRLWYVRCSVR